MIITVDQTTYEGGTISLGHGVTEEGERVTFAAEPGMLYDIACAIDDGIRLAAWVEPWQLLTEVGAQPTGG